ncbi:MAG: 4-phosphoerythronate dehydrogenase [Pseudoflavonifractor sp.]|nr:4-phosphoerythronate dehydrogenase [Pseudoflavonifractor sp.]
MSRPRIIIERNIPFIAGLLDSSCDVAYLSAGEITPGAMRDADGLITRTRTRCDAALLDGSRCRFIATATIGTDHIDPPYCREHGITVVNAPGCNAPAVAQYVCATILSYLRDHGDGREPSDLTLGIVGVGHVGSIVERWGRQLGFRVLCCDPPRAVAEGPGGFTDINTIAAESDIITFHTPLTREGTYPTVRLCDNSLLAKMTRRPLVINSSRGAVTDNAALVKAIDSGTIAAAAIDCWENEPNISLALLDRAFVATPHIAGYSREGKIRATSMVVRALCDFFGLPQVDVAERVPAGAARCVTPAAILHSYDPLADTAALKADPAAFESLRNNYLYRDEVPECTPIA